MPSHSLVHAVLSQSGSRKNFGEAAGENMVVKTNASGHVDISQLPMMLITSALQDDMLAITWFLGGA